MTEEAARGIVADDHPYCFGFFDLSQHQPANLVREADVVLLLGKLLDFSVGFGLPPIVAQNAKLIQVDPAGVQVGRNRGVEVGIPGAHRARARPRRRNRQRCARSGRRPLPQRAGRRAAAARRLESFRNDRRTPIDF